MQRVGRLRVGCMPDAGGGRDGLGQAEKDWRHMLGGDHRYFVRQDNDGKHSGSTAQHEKGARVHQDSKRCDPQAMVHCSGQVT